MEIHQRLTPKRIMTNVLKNNLLKGPSLSLLCNITNIDGIQVRLRRPYGDPKLLPKKIDSFL